ncbi:MAG: YdcH family protein [Magnetococcales bacterium]|nr:YdcH family protein [Magnetococcales bacterium]
MSKDETVLVQELLAKNNEFRALHEEHQSLKQQIGETGRTMDQFTVERLKKRKLQLKDQMAVILAASSKG